MDSKEKFGLSIILPVYNEQAVIEKTVRQLLEVKENADFETEIIIVNDCSHDGTVDILKNLAQEEIIIIDHPRNRGYGSAIKSGIKAAKFSIIGITDADATYPNERFAEFFHEMQEKKLDMVVGARTGPNVNIPLIRKPAKWLLNLLANYLTDEKIPDLNSGFRVIKKEVFKKFIHILPEGFSLTSTITLAMLTNGFSVKYNSIDYYNRKGRSKIRPIYDTLNFLQLIIRTVLYFNPLKIFIPCFLILLLCAAAVFGGSWLIIGKVMDVTVGILLMTAVIILAIGMLADLIDKRMN